MGRMLMVTAVTLHVYCRQGRGIPIFGYISHNGRVPHCLSKVVVVSAKSVA